MIQMVFPAVFVGNEIGSPRGDQLFPLPVTKSSQKPVLGKSLAKRSYQSQGKWFFASLTGLVSSSTSSPPPEPHVFFLRVSGGRVSYCLRSGTPPKPKVSLWEWLPTMLLASFISSPPPETRVLFLRASGTGLLWSTNVAPMRLRDCFREGVL